MSLSSILSKEIAKKRKKHHKSTKVKKHKPDEIPQITSTGQETPELTAKQLTMLNSITDKELKQQLQAFNDYDSKLSKLENIRKLKKLQKLDDKQQRYQAQQDKEAKVDKVLRLDEITDLKYKSKLLTQLRVYIKYLISNWETYLQSQASEESSSSSSRHEQTTLLYETKLDLVILLYNLRSDKLSDNMVTSLSTICYYLQSKDYLKSTESYMKLSIGNVAWPIGVRGVGIHERSGDSKITGESNTANIMIDDRTRRWIVGIKRLITFHESHPEISTLPS